MNIEEKYKILLLEDDFLLAEIYGKFIENAGFECVSVKSIVEFWLVFNPTEFIATIIDNEVVGGSFIDEYNVECIFEKDIDIIIGLNSAFKQERFVKNSQCEDLNKDPEKIKNFLRKLQIRYIPMNN